MEEDTTITEMTIEVTPPAKFAWYFYSALDFVQVHMEVASAYAELGSFYAENLLKWGSRKHILIELRQIFRTLKSQFFAKMRFTLFLPFWVQNGRLKEVEKFL